MYNNVYLKALFLLHSQLWNSKADKIIKLKYIVNFVANAWATFKAFSNANASPVFVKPIHCQM